MQSDITARTFEGIEFVERRIAHNLTDYDRIPKELAAAYGTPASAVLPIDAQLGELVRLLIAVNSRCSYCAILHAGEARKLGVIEAKVDGIAAWRQSSLYSIAELAAFEYAEALSHERHRDIQRAHDALAAHFDQTGIEALMMVVINMNMWTRIFLARGRTPRAAID